MSSSGLGAPQIVEQRGLAQISDAAVLEKTVAQVLRENPEEVTQYLEGKEQILGWLMGQVMRVTRGKANPQMVRELLQVQLEELQG
jgi:aspartyl-tRNA(Asn)/glutamyl-tRNA(Gln) amidotransferase subunit B